MLLFLGVDKMGTPFFGIIPEKAIYTNLGFVYVYVLVYIYIYIWIIHISLQACYKSGKGVKQLLVVVCGPKRGRSRPTGPCKMYIG